MSGKMKIAIGSLVTLLFCTAIVLCWRMNTRFDVIHSYGELKEEAYSLYESGNTPEAIKKLESYCMYVVTDIDAKTLLGDWYLQMGDFDKAYEQYYLTCESKKAENEEVAPLTVKNKSEILIEPYSEIVMEITPDVRCTKDMTLTVSSANLAPKNRIEGKIVLGKKELESSDNYYTTDWFDVNPEGGYLTMSGGFNCAIWQFIDKNGAICAQLESENEYRTANTKRVDVYQMARVVIVEKAVKCRVTYFDKSKESRTLSPYEELSIVYGRLPGESKDGSLKSYKIPDLQEGEKIVYNSTGWHLETKDTVTDLTEWELPDIERGSCVSIDGTLPGRVSFKNSVKSQYAKDGIYTVRFKEDSPSAVGERLDDAKNLGFNASVGSDLITLGDNDFDNIYPWKDMKLCAVQDGKITYYGDENFTTDGTSGDVFVEIPKFYVKRVVDGNFDTISISGEQHPGFEIDEAFVKDGRTVDKIYVAAYFSAEGENGETVSYADKTPWLNMSFNEIKKATEKKGEGYYEADYATISALQKLFMVETGLRNSQYLYMGICAYDESGEEYSLALNTSNNTNCIVTQDDTNFEKGNNILIFDSARGNEGIKEALGDVRSVKTVRSNSDGTVSVFFTGDAISIEKGKTALMHIAIDNSNVRNVATHTGASGTTRGTVGLKYRNIENPWGNAYVYVDNVEVKNDTVTIEKRDGNTHTLAFKLPSTIGQRDENLIIRRMGYDVNCPNVFLPSEVNSLTGTSTFYGDIYKGGEADDKYVLRYGGSWKMGGYAGIFAYEANVTADEKMLDTTGRMIYFK